MLFCSENRDAVQSNVIMGHLLGFELVKEKRESKGLKSVWRCLCVWGCGSATGTNSYLDSLALEGRLVLSLTTLSVMCQFCRPIPTGQWYLLNHLKAVWVVTSLYCKMVTPDASLLWRPDSNFGRSKHCPCWLTHHPLPFLLSSLFFLSLQCSIPFFLFPFSLPSPLFPLQHCLSVWSHSAFLGGILNPLGKQV